MGVTEILCSFRSVLQRKAGKEIPESSRLEFLEKLFAKDFALSDAEKNISEPLIRGGIPDLPLLRALSAIRQKFWGPSFWEMICECGSFKKPFATITKPVRMSECYFRFKRFILLVQTKRVISMNYGRSTSSWKPWRRVRIHLIFTMSYIYINSNLHPLTEFTSSSRSTEFKYILPRYISQIITKIIPISTRVVITYAMKRSIPLWVSQKVNGNWGNILIKISNGWKATVEQILASEEINKFKRAGHLR